jgi:hypothetical protein
MDLSCPKEFRDDVRKKCIDNEWIGSNAEFDKFFTINNLEGEVNYSCSACMTSLRWGCHTCNANLDPTKDNSVMVYLSVNDLSLSFYSYRPQSQFVKDNWPEVHSKAKHWALMCSKWYCHYNPVPVPECRDVPSSDDPKYRLQLSPDLQRKMWNIMLPEQVFAATPADLKRKTREENERRWLEYGPGTHGQSTAQGVLTYRDVRVPGSGDIDAEQYVEHMKQVNRVKQRAEKAQKAEEFGARAQTGSEGVGPCLLIRTAWQKAEEFGSEKVM